MREHHGIRLVGHLDVDSNGGNVHVRTVDWGVGFPGAPAAQNLLEDRNDLVGVEVSRVLGSPSGRVKIWLIWERW